MRDVGQQLFLGAPQIHDAVGHFVEGSAQIADFVATRVARADRELSGAEGARQRGQPLDGRSDRPREWDREQRKHPEGRRQLRGAAADRQLRHGVPHARVADDARALQRGDDAHPACEAGRLARQLGELGSGERTGRAGRVAGNQPPVCLE